MYNLIICEVFIMKSVIIYLFIMLEKTLSLYNFATFPNTV